MMVTATQPTPTAARRRRWWLILPLIVVAVPLTGLGGLLGMARANLVDAPIAPRTAALHSFDGRYLLVLSDADMVATAYADGVLQQVPGISDALTLVELPLATAAPAVHSLNVSNSVMTWPQMMAASPDGTTVYVVEGRPQVDDSLEQIAQVQVNWPAGEVLTRIDLSDSAANATTETFPIGVNPNHLALSADGAYLAIGMRSVGEHITDQHLAIVPTAELGSRDAYRYFGVQTAAGEVVGEVSSVAWHPSGRFLAVGVDTTEFFFYEVFTNEAGRLDLRPHGQRFTGFQTLGVGRFSPDGRFYFASDIRWAEDGDLLGMATNPPGEMIAVRFDAENSAHELVSRVQVGQSPEGWALHPSGRYIVTVNMNRTYVPDNLAALVPGGQTNSLSLVEVNAETGALTVHGHYGFEGVLPEDAVFDADGDALAVVIYEYHEDNPHLYGGLDFWNLVEGDGTPRLERSSTRLQITRGGHVLGLIP